jgi:hypothetical protein
MSSHQASLCSYIAVRNSNIVLYFNDFPAIFKFLATSLEGSRYWVRRMTRQRAGRSKNRGSIPSWSECFSPVQSIKIRMTAHSASYSIDPWPLSAGLRRPGGKADPLTDLVSKLSGASPPVSRMRSWRAEGLLFYLKILLTTPVTL